MEERDRARREIKSTTGEKHLIVEKYVLKKQSHTTVHEWAGHFGPLPWLSENHHMMCSYNAISGKMS